MRVLFAVMAAALLAACGGGGKPTPTKAPPAGKGAAAAATPAAAAAAPGEVPPPTQEYVYTPIGKRDPFRSFFQDQSITEMVKPNPRCGPLCRWDLDQLRLVAVVSGVSSPMAMVEAPDGVGYVLRRGSFVGKRQGKVSDIRRDALVVTELIRGNDGVIIPAKTDLKLRGGDRSGGKIVEEPVDLLSSESDK